MSKSFILLLILSISASAAADDLPSETSLPGQAVVVPPAKNLPPETELPAGRLSPSYAIEQPINPLELPSEMTLPTLVQAQPDAEPQDALPPIGKDPHRRPWLRLNFSGHTGTVRAMAYTPDGKYLCTGGEDKVVQIWAQPAAGNGRWMNQRTVRWQVRRGNLGRIYALATGANLLAMAGHGAMGGLGEILLIDPATGELKRALVDEQNGHRQVIVGMSFSPDPNAPALASIDFQGQVMYWSRDADTGLWQAKRINGPDPETYGEAIAQLIQPNRRTAQVVMVGPNHLVTPVFTHVDVTRKTEYFPDGLRLWELELINIKTGVRKRLTADQPHTEAVTKLAASPTGTRLASADDFGNLFMWDLTKSSVGKRLQQKAKIVSLDFNANGDRLIAGTARSPLLNGNSVLQTWDSTTPLQPRLLNEVKLNADVHDCRIHPQTGQVTYAQGNAVIPAGGERLEAPVRGVRRVAFAKDRPFYRIAIGTSTDGFDEVFDTYAVQLERKNRINEDDWIPTRWWSGNPWTLRSEGPPGQQTFWLFEKETKRGQLELNPNFDGTPVSTCWIPDRTGRVAYVAVGTDGTNNIYVYQIAAAGKCPLLRQFRGHVSAVRSIGVSKDLRYLVSGSDDATVRVWKLEGFDSSDTITNRWGAEFETRNGQLIASQLREDGPLFFRGVRAGDVIHTVKWNEQGVDKSANTPAEMLNALTNVHWNTLVALETSRAGVEQPVFQSFIAWQEVVSLFVAENRQWAYWTPAGFYDSSFDGHKLFGWQINHGLNVLPEFFLAAQFRNALEKPDVMEKLLQGGSLEEAFRLAQQPAPAASQNAIIDEYRLKPRVEILAPRHDERVAGRTTTVRAAITVRDGLELVPPKVFANGVSARESRVVAEDSVPGGRRVTYEWDAALPSDSRIVIQVVAATEAKSAAFQSVTVDHTVDQPLTPRLFVFAAGVNHYQDAQIQRLDYAVNNAESVADAFRQRTDNLYRSEVVSLLDSQATRSMWKIVTSDYAEQLAQEVTPDDLLVVFLSGHGVRDEVTEKYYYIPADARYADVMSQRYEDCMSFEDLAAFGDIPCRKLVILDTCHSGAVQQPLEQKDLKAALRSLQDDLVFTLTASEGNQEAVEEKDRMLGRFTSRLLEALAGQADQTQYGGNKDGIVSLQEAVAYVQQTVQADSARDAYRQFPTAGPIDLLPYVELPLTRGF